MMTTFTPWAFPETENLVVVVGAGGIGARVLPTLVKMLPQGRSQVTVVDPDVVERRNILRQPFGEEDIGQAKALVMQDRYDTPEVPVVGIMESYSPAVFQGIMLPTRGLTRLTYVLGCVDNSQARFAMLIHAMQTTTFWTYLDAGNDGTRGQVVVARSRWVDALDSKVYKTLSGWDKYANIFVPFDEPGPRGCDRVDTQAPLTNQVAATWLLQYLGIFLAGQVLGSLGVSFSTLGAATLHPMTRDIQGLYRIEGEKGLSTEQLRRVAEYRRAGLSEVEALKKAGIAVPETLVTPVAPPVPVPPMVEQASLDEEPLELNYNDTDEEVDPPDED